jgi:hypothetical protein
VSEDALIEPRTVATLASAARRSLSTRQDSSTPSINNNILYRKLMGDPVKRHGIDWDSPNFTGYFYTSEEFLKEPFFITQPGRRFFGGFYDWPCLSPVCAFMI